MGKTRKTALLAACGILCLFMMKSSVPQTVSAAYWPVTAGVSFMMDTLVEQRWYGENGPDVYRRVLGLLAEMEASLSVYRSGSELSKLNAAAGKDAVALSERSYELLKRSISFSRLSGGEFDITIGPVSALWGITSEAPKVPSQAEIDDAVSLVDWEHLILNDDLQTARLQNNGMAVDPGGVAKGFACDVLMREIGEGSRLYGYVSLGGNIMAVGRRPDGSPMRFGIRDPFGESGDSIGSLPLVDGVMATAGVYERFFVRGGVRYHHVMDASTGYPADTDLVAVTVVSNDGGLADALSTWILTAGTKRLDIFLRDTSYGVVAIDKDKNIYMSEALRQEYLPGPADAGYHYVR